MMTVCENWFELLNEYFPRDNCIVLSENSDISRGGRLYNTFSKRMQLFKAKRSFPCLVINSFPTDFDEIYKVSSFLYLIGEDVKFLTIYEMPYYAGVPDNWINEYVYSKMPNLKTLEVSEGDLLGDLNFPKGLQEIKVDDEVHDMEQVNNVRKIKNIRKFTFHGILFDKYNKPHAIFIKPSFKKILEQLIVKDGSITVISNYNYCGESKMEPNDVIAFRFDKCINFFASPFINYFKNLKVKQPIFFQFVCITMFFFVFFIRDWNSAI